MKSPRMPVRRDAPLCFEKSQWHALLFDARNAQGADLASAVGRFGGRLQVLRLGFEDPSDRHQWAHAVARVFCREVYSRLYGDPRPLLSPDASEPWAGWLHGVLDGVPEFASLRETVQGDPDLSAVAAARVISELAERLSEETVNQDRQLPPGSGPSQAARSAARRAAMEAAKEAGEIRSALAGLLPGSEAVPASHEQPDTGRMMVIQQVRESKEVKKVLELAGRLRRIRDTKNKARSARAREEVFAVERGGDVGRALPSGLARLRHPGMRRLALRDVVERSMVQYELQGTEPEGRGPLVVLLDRSGSMAGRPHLYASAVGVAAMGAALLEGRPAAVVSFNAGVSEVVQATPGQRAASRVLTPRAGTWSGPQEGQGLVKASEAAPLKGGAVAGAYRVASGVADGGTSFEAPFEAALEMVESLPEMDRADVVFVTDGQGTLSAALLARVKDWRVKKGLRVYGATVNGGSVTPAVRELCDRVVDLDGSEDWDGDAAELIP